MRPVLIRVATTMGDAYVLNAECIATMNAMVNDPHPPGTTITLLNGGVIHVAEDVDEVVTRIIDAQG